MKKNLTKLCLLLLAVLTACAFCACTGDAPANVDGNVMTPAPKSTDIPEETHSKVATPAPLYTATREAGYTTVLSLDIGDEDGEIGCSYDFGPEEFYIDGDSIYILDTINCRIQLYISGVFAKAYPIPDCVHARNFCIAGDRFIVYDSTEDKLIVFGEGYETEYLDFPSGFESINILRLEYNDNKVIIVANSYDKYSIELGSDGDWELEHADISIREAEFGFTVSTKYGTRDIEAKANEEITYLGESSEYLYLAFYEFAANSSTIKSELTVRRYDSAGNGEYVPIDKDDWIAYPLNQFFVGDDAAYMLICKADAVEIVAFDFGKE